MANFTILDENLINFKAPSWRKSCAGECRVLDILRLLFHEINIFLGVLSVYS